MLALLAVVQSFWFSHVGYFQIYFILSKYFRIMISVRPLVYQHVFSYSTFSYVLISHVDSVSQLVRSVTCSQAPSAVLRPGPGSGRDKAWYQSLGSSVLGSL